MISGSTSGCSLERDCVGFRDIAAHKSQTLRMEDVYETVTSDFPVLYSQLESILAQ
ncbi:HepT-like ribonuclease domain-containing protein [uncultured Pseudoflavonifractor sp.]|uniref:HepT-like ribonuclease domain-containing protein n=1 Tax=uncultured Pseudoflavonifractor sp. TaxID=1221379 RepID=UPI00345CF2F6